ncbi:kelch repeat-containing protein [Deinococcus sp. KSM4-11]|uniref:Kelch repeat-containing protein n=1 Tax=Deinococcus sp. KSM4-11 TaxID=2568654 RepID=UPI001F0E8D88|nr:kelch repeat-containing protein [Deinococcus sp. KSM4-11]
MPTRLLPLHQSACILLTLLLTACTTPSSPGAAPGPAGTLTWTPATPSPTPLYEGQGAVVDGKLYVFGGFSENRDDKPIVTRAAHVYDPANEHWAALKDTPDPVTHAGTAVDGTDIYMAGGFLGNHPGPQTDHVWRYDTHTDTWTALPPLPGARGAGALVRVGRDLHYFGGTERTDAGLYLRDDSDHWVLNLDVPTAWQSRAPLPNARNHIGAVVLDGLIYAVGGQHLGDEAHGDLRDVHRYDPATDSWTSIAPLPLPLGHITASTVIWNGRIVVVGGVTLATNGGAIEGKESNTVLTYDPSLNKWSALTSLPGPRQSPVAGVIGGKMIVTTGSTTAGPVATTFIGH